MENEIQAEARELLKKIETKNKLDVNEYCLALALVEYFNHL